jgi:hypothetical protein
LTLQVGVGERASVVKHADNLRMEGSFEGLKSEMHEAHQVSMLHNVFSSLMKRLKS